MAATMPGTPAMDSRNTMRVSHFLSSITSQPLYANLPFLSTWAEFSVYPVARSIPHRASLINRIASLSCHVFASRCAMTI